MMNSKNTTSLLNSTDNQLIVDLSLSKTFLFQSLCTSTTAYNMNNITLIDHMKDEYIKIKKRLDDSFHLKLSNSLIVFGRSFENTNQLISSVLQSYEQYNNHYTNSFITSLAHRNQNICKNYTIKVNGFAHLTDHEAIIDMANQFYTRNDKDSRDFNTALEDLEHYFIQCRLDGIPAVIIIEDIHVFAKRKRQTLIYTLLDLMHKKECLFTIIGITDHADIQHYFEKRITSRLNAQYIFLPNPTATHVCEYFANKLLLPPITAIVTTTDDTDVVDRYQDFQYVNEISHEYITTHNNTIQKLFGSYHHHHHHHHQMKDNNATTQHFIGGSLFAFIAMYIEWGRGLEDFNAAALKVLTMLNHIDNAYWSQELFQKAIVSMDPPRVLDILGSLTPIELHLIISVAHLYGKQRGATTSSSSTVYTSHTSTDNKNIITVEKVLLVCDMLVDVFRKKITPKCRVLQALCSLAQKDLIFLANVTPGRARYHVDTPSLGIVDQSSNSNNNDSTGISSVTGRTLVLLTIPYDEIKKAFRLTSRTDISEASNPSVLDIYNSIKEEERHVIVVPERLRRAACEPLEPILYTNMMKRDVSYIL